MEFSEKFICKYEGFDTILNMSIKLCHEILIILLCNLALEWMSSEFHFWCTFWCLVRPDWFLQILGHCGHLIAPSGTWISFLCADFICLFRPDFGFFKPKSFLPHMGHVVVFFFSSSFSSSMFIVSSFRAEQRSAFLSTGGSFNCLGCVVWSLSEIFKLWRSIM